MQDWNAARYWRHRTPIYEFFSPCSPLQHFLPIILHQSPLFLFGQFRDLSFPPLLVLSLSYPSSPLSPTGLCLCVCVSILFYFSTSQFLFSYPSFYIVAGHGNDPQSSKVHIIISNLLLTWWSLMTELHTVFCVCKNKRFTPCYLVRTASREHSVITDELSRDKYTVIITGW